MIGSEERPQKLRAKLTPFIFDGSEAVEALVLMSQSPSRPPDLRRAIAYIVQRYYADCVPIETVLPHIHQDGEERAS